MQVNITLSMGKCKTWIYVLYAIRKTLQIWCFRLEQLVGHLLPMAIRFYQIL